MSNRVASKPIELPSAVQTEYKDNTLTVKGKHGELKLVVDNTINLNVEEKTLTVSTDSSDNNAIAGTTRALINNMVTGVCDKFQKTLILKGVGYRAILKGKILELSLGFSHSIKFAIPTNIIIECKSQTEVVISGVDKQLVGQTAADIRSYRKPEPYKGKGIRYSDEVIKLKDTKK